MSMFSEIATENNIERLVKFLAKELETESSPEACNALKRVGRWALTQFDWDTPPWATEYIKLFQE